MLEVPRDLPARLDTVWDDVALGAFIKHLKTGVVAIIIDCVGDWGKPMIVRAKDKFQANGKSNLLPSKPSDYKIELIDRSEDWLVLTPGEDFALVE